MSVAVPVQQNNEGSSAATYQLPRRRISYLIPPPPEDQPPPLLALPAPHEVKEAKRGNPNPLIILASELDARQKPRFGNPHDDQFATSPSSSSKSGRGGSYNGASPLRNGKQHVQATQRHPEHTLGVSALALDTSTVIDSTHNGQQKPAGILYSGGRDALVASWELSLPLKRRDAAAPSDRYPQSEQRGRRYRPRWAEDPYDSPTSSDEDDDIEDNRSSSSRDSSSAENQPVNKKAFGTSPRLRLDTTFNDNSSEEPRARPSNGLHLNFSQSSPRNGHRPRKRTSRLKDATIPYEDRWCIDTSAISVDPPKASFRQAHRAHTDWINDIVLCNLNQTVISASSDRLIRAWNPHDPHASMLPATLGSHNDYVKCLAHSREHRWIASGGFDRQMKVWDVMESRPDPIVDIACDASVYSLATNAAGALIACGSPEKIVHIYDPRQATNSVARLVGHADNVRSILVSADGRHILSASSDATVKLWSVAMQRCLHTFTFHSDSVWSLASSHPDLEVFYSGDRAGTVCKTDFADCGDIASEGECLVLLRNRDDSKPGSYPSPNDGINRIVATGDTYLWTASGSSDIRRWRDIPSRSDRSRAEQMAARQPSLQYGGDVASQPILSSSYGSSDVAAPVRDSTVDSSPVQPTQANERSVAFAPDFVNTHRAIPGQSGSALQQRLSSFRKASRTFSNSPSIEQPGNAGASSPKHLGEAFQPSTSKETPDETPSLNGLPLESLVPLFTPDDPYARPSAYGLRSDGTGGVGYSASVLSLHRTNSRPLTSSSPFGGVLSSSPHSSGLAPRNGFSSHMFGRNSPRPIGILGDPRARSIIEADEDAAVGSGSRQPKNEAYLLAYQEYEDRETALDAVPLRNSPDEIIRGRHGLIRAILLNDRRTVVSLDTLGEVAVWDIVLGGCIGRFSKIELRHRLRLEHASLSDSGHGDDVEDLDKADVLEYVRTQIEGETVVSPWCSVESRTGLLTVHIDQTRAFEAEVYLDEAGVQARPEFKADQRLNLGKWVLRNLLEGFIQEEIKVQARRRSLSATSSSSMSSLSSEEVMMYNKDRRPSHVSISRASFNNIEGSGSDLFGMTPAGFNIALATPAMTPAVLPSASELQAQYASPRLLPASLPQSMLPTIPQSPHATGSAPATPLSTGAQADYFSRPRTSTAPATPGGGTHTPRAGSSLPAVPTLPPSTLNKPSKMSRFKSFGRKETKKDISDTFTSAPIDTTPSSAPAVGADDDLPLPERAQRQLINAALSRPIQASPLSEAPQIRFAGDLVMMIGEEAQDAGAWATVYRGPISQCASNVKELEAVLPQWLLDFSLHNIIRVREPIKIAFVLEPWGGPEKAGLPELPSGNARLSATRMLRMRKACHYVAEKLELESWKQRQQYLAAIDAQQASGSKSNDLARSQTGSSLSSASYGHIPGLAHPEGPDLPGLLPEDEIEILCHDQVVPLNITLAACARYSYGKSGDIPLTYRRRGVGTVL